MNVNCDSDSVNREVMNVNCDSTRSEDDTLNFDNSIRTGEDLNVLVV